MGGACAGVPFSYLLKAYGWENVAYAWCSCLAISAGFFSLVGSREDVKAKIE